MPIAVIRGSGRAGPRVMRIVAPPGGAALLVVAGP